MNSFYIIAHDNVKDGHLPLHVTALKNVIETAAILLHHGVDADAIDDVLLSILLKYPTALQ